MNPAEHRVGFSHERNLAEPETNPWERVNSETSRLKVPGGWLYRTLTLVAHNAQFVYGRSAYPADPTHSQHVHIVFVPA